jgi:hypothetical protein
MCSYTITSRYAPARMTVRSRVPHTSVFAIARSGYEPSKIVAKRPAAPCGIMARSQHNPVKEQVGLFQIALIDGDGSILLDDLGNILIIGYCNA